MIRERVEKKSAINYHAKVKIFAARPNLSSQKYLFAKAFLQYESIRIIEIAYVMY